MSTIWINYDLGVSGDYEGMYEWLDDHNAIECGSSFAFIKQYDHDGEDLMDALKHDIQDCVLLGKRSRIYVIRRIDGRGRGSSFLAAEKGHLGMAMAKRVKPPTMKRNLET